MTNDLSTAAVTTRGAIMTLCGLSASGHIPPTQATFPPSHLVYQESGRRVVQCVSGSTGKRTGAYLMRECLNTTTLPKGADILTEH